MSLVLLAAGWFNLSCKKENQTRPALLQSTTGQKPAVEDKNPKNPNQPVSVMHTAPPQPVPATSEQPKTIISLQNRRLEKPADPVNKPLKPMTVTSEASEALISQDNGLLSVSHTSGVLFPDDFKIGPVLNNYQMHADQSEIYDLVMNFIGSLIKKEIKKDLIESHRRDLLVTSLDYYIQSALNIIQFRLGKIQLENRNTGGLRVRFFSDKTTSNGYVYVIKEGENWLITDLQINFLELAAQDREPKEKFEPSAWSDYDY